MLTISGGDRWRCEIPEAEWPKGPKVREATTRDFEGKWGDRRQEIVFIGSRCGPVGNSVSGKLLTLAS